MSDFGRRGRWGNPRAGRARSRGKRSTAGRETSTDGCRRTSAGEKRDHEEDDGDDDQHVAYLRGQSRHAPHPQHRGDECDDEEEYRVMKHVSLLLKRPVWTSRRLSPRQREACHRNGEPRRTPATQSCNLYGRDSSTTRKSAVASPATAMSSASCLAKTAYARRRSSRPPTCTETRMPLPTF